MDFTLAPDTVLPEDGYRGMLVGRVWLPTANGLPGGPSVVVITQHGVYDVTNSYPTSSDLMNADKPNLAAANADGAIRIGSPEEILLNSSPDKRNPEKPYFLAPIDLQSIKACGVTLSIVFWNV